MCHSGSRHLEMLGHADDEGPVAQLGQNRALIEGLFPGIRRHVPKLDSLEYLAQARARARRAG
jgi:hypothetical protein